MSLRHSILAVLSRRSRTGYELSRGIGESIGHFWPASHQQIYRELAALESAGWVEFREVAQAERPDKKVYSLTPRGRAELVRWIGEPTAVAPGKDAFLIKLFVGDLVAPEALQADLRAQKAVHLARLREYSRIARRHFADPERLARERRFPYLTLRRGIAFERAWLSWCREAEAMLAEGPRGARTGRSRPARAQAGQA